MYVLVITSYGHGTAMPLKPSPYMNYIQVCKKQPQALKHIFWQKDLVTGIHHMVIQKFVNNKNKFLIMFLPVACLY